MRRGGRLFILLGVMLAIVAVLLAVMSLGGDRTASDDTVSDTPKAQVIQASRDLPASTVLEEGDVELVEVDESAVSPGAAISPGQVVGLSINGNMVRGQQILMANLVTPGLSHVVNDGMRALALPVDRVNAVGGLIRADDYVDLVYSTRLNLVRLVPSEPAEMTDSTEGVFDEDPLTVPPYGQQPGATYPYPGEAGSRFLVKDTTEGDPVTKVILQGIRVIRVIAGDQAVESGASSTESANGDDASGDTEQVITDRLPSTDLLILEVDPQQAEVIKFLQDNQGLVQISLRSRDDLESIATSGISYEQLVTQYGLPVPKSVRLGGE